MTARPFPTPQRLRQLLRYEAETGKLFWLPRPREMFASQRSCSTWNARFAGREALTAASNGYRVGHIDFKLCMAHRVIWALVHGYWPDQVDHVSGNRGDNRFANLREATKSENVSNTPLRADNTSGFKGVTFQKSNQKWNARITKNGVCHNLGYFETAEAAHAAYRTAAPKHHGEFARAA